MNTITKLARKIGSRKRKYYTIHIKPDDYCSFKSVAVQQKMNYVDFFHELPGAFINCRKANHEVIIHDLLRKQDALVDKLQLYQKRFGKIYLSPAANTLKSS